MNSNKNNKRQANGIPKPGNPPPAKSRKQAPRASPRNPMSRVIDSPSNSFAPVAFSAQQTTRKPLIERSGGTDGRTRVRHREYIGDIAGSVLYAVQQYSINPGLVATFPWLAQLAQAYESYKFNSLRFEFKTLAATSTAGKVIYSVDYDASDAPPAGKQEQLQAFGARDCAAWEHLVLLCDKMDLEKLPQRYVRAGALPANQDIKTYDVGNLNVGVAAMAGSSVVGELYVVYDVELITPQQVSTPAANQKIVGSGTASRAFPFTGNPTLSGDPIASAAAQTLTFSRPGQYLLEVKTVGTVFSAAPALTGTCTSSVLDNIIDSGALNEISMIRVTAPSAGTLVFDYSAACTTLTAITVRIAQYTYSLA